MDPGYLFGRRRCASRLVSSSDRDVRPPDDVDPTVAALAGRARSQPSNLTNSVIDPVQKLGELAYVGDSFPAQLSGRLRKIGMSPAGGPVSKGLHARCAGHR